LAENISDIIERYIKQIIDESQNGMIELQRSELAELFQCVPSQINYVINTRFSIEHGYVVESKRGGGGYIRIRQVRLSSDDPVLDLIQSIGDQIAQREAEGIIGRLERDGLITEREAALLRTVVSRDVLRIDLPYRDELRARLLTQALAVLLATEPSSGSARKNGAAGSADGSVDGSTNAGGSGAEPDHGSRPGRDANQE
jgi:transcriptional regulator CtsR